ncbi:integrase, catalytic region, zinc finger, CCHC-type containing protein [Tanacetum coccineum]
MEADVEQFSLNKKYCDIQKKEVSLDNDRLLDHIICQDVMNIVMHADSILTKALPAINKCFVNDNLEIERLEQENDHLFELLLSQDIVHIYVNFLALRNNCREMQQGFIDEYNENLMLKAELAKKGQIVEKTIFDEVEVLFYVKDTCPSLTKPSKKLVAITPFIKNKKVRFAEANTSSRMKSSTSASRSQPSGNTKNNMILRTTSINMKIKVEDHPRSVTSKSNKMNRVIEHSLDSRCSKHITGNRSQLINFVHKFLGTIRFGNDQIAKIMVYGDYQMGNVMISRVYYVEGLGHNLFSVGQFCDFDLEVAFRKHTCYIRDLEGVDLLKGSRGSNLYILSLEDMMLSSPICLLSKASKTKSWLWHRRLSRLNFNYITTLAKQGLVRGLPRLKFQKDHSCFACALGLMPNPPLLTPYVPPTKKDCDTLFQPMFDEYFNPLPSVASPVLAIASPVLTDSTSLPSLTLVDQDASSPKEFHDIEVAHLNNDPFFGIPITEPTSEESSSRDVITTNVHSVNQPPEYLSKWTKDHPLDNVIGNPSRPVSTRHQLQNKALFCYFDAFLSSVEPNNYKEALKESCWIEAMQE